MEDSDVEMLGSPVLPKIKTENDGEPDETECIDVGDSNDEEVENNVESDMDKDPMNLLELLDRQESFDNDKKKKSSRVDDGEELNDNRNFDGKRQNDSYKVSNDDGSSYKASNGEASTDRESESEDATTEENLNNKVPDGKMKTVQKEETADEKSSKQFARLAETMPWLCRDQENPDRVFCLYCLVSINNRSVTCSKHETSQQHQERTVEYSDFMKIAGDDVICLKTNKDFDGDIKKEREKLEEKLADYVWGLWSKSHDWIMRTKTSGYIGYCKYCCVEMSVLTSRQRKTHEESNRHKEAKRKYPRRRKTVTGDALSVDSEYSDTSSDKASEQTIESMKGSSYIKEIPDPTENEYFEKSKSSADLCRCKLCDITMFKASFMRHSSSNLHKQNLAVLDNPVVPDKIEKPEWQTYQTLHPWLIEDPNNPMEAFCKYCAKRIMYGTSAAKRLIHEHSAPHKAAVKNAAGAEAAKAKKAASSEKNQDENEEVEQEESVEESSEDDDENEKGDNGSDQMQEDKESESKSGNNSETETETASTQPETKLGAIFSCIKPYQRDGKYVFCRYCKIILQNLSKTIKLHFKTQRHIKNEKIFTKRSNAVKHAKSKMKASQGASSVFEYPWLVKFKNKADVVFCKYCRIRFSAKGSRTAHQNSRRHVEAAKKFEQIQAQEKPAESTVPPLKVVVNRPVHSTKIAVKKKIPQKQLKSMFEWVQFKKGMKTNYGYCTFCKKELFIPSIKYGNRHKRTSFHLRARNEKKRQSEKQTTESLKRNKTDSDPNHDKNKSVDPNASAPGEPPAKRFKPNSLHAAIETAKRLSSIHLEMLTFMRNSGRRNSKPSTESGTLTTTPSPTLPSQTVSTIADLNATLSPIVQAATQANKRDPFDLFFNSISESIKILPPDLASEAKLKVMQVIFDLETRAQQRHSQPQEQQQSQQEQQLQQQPSDQINAAPNANTNGSTRSDIPSPNSIILETPSKQIEREAVRVRQPTDQQPEKQQSHLKLGQSPLTVTTTSAPSNAGGPRTFYIQTSTSNSANSQQRQTTNLTPQPQASSNIAQAHRSCATKTTSNPSPFQANTIVHAQCKIQPQQQQQVTQQNIQTPTSQRDGLVRHRIVTNQLNNLVSNVNQRINVNNPTMPAKTNTGLTISSVNSLAGDNQSNSARANNRAPQIRTVPLSSLTKAKYQNTTGNEPTFHQIQLNSSTQSKIITIDANNFQRL